MVALCATVISDDDNGPKQDILGFLQFQQLQSETMLISYYCTFINSSLT